MKPGDWHCKNFTLSKNKSAELQLSRWEDSRFFDLDAQIRSKNHDHAGFRVALTLFYYEFSLDFYDHRHADVRFKEQRSAPNPRRKGRTKDGSGAD
jgi:hypothetical protein